MGFKVEEECYNGRRPLLVLSEQVGFKVQEAATEAKEAFRFYLNKWDLKGSLACPFQLALQGFI